MDNHLSPFSYLSLASRRGRSSVGEHLLCMQGVRGSNPLASTTLRPQSLGEASWATGGKPPLASLGVTLSERTK